MLFLRTKRTQVPASNLHFDYTKPPTKHRWLFLYPNSLLAKVLQLNCVVCELYLCFDAHTLCDILLHATL